MPFAWTLRPPCSVHPVTAIRKYGSADALRTTTSSDEASAVRAKLHVDVGMGYFRAHDCRRACFSARRRDSEVTTHLSCTRRSAAPLWKAGNQGEVPSAGILQLGSSSRSGTQIRGRECTPETNFIRKSVCLSSRTRRRFRYWLVSSARLLESVLSIPGTRFEAERQHVPPFLPSPVCFPRVGRLYLR